MYKFSHLKLKSILLLGSPCWHWTPQIKKQFSTIRGRIGFPLVFDIINVITNEHTIIRNMCEVQILLSNTYTYSIAITFHNNNLRLKLEFERKSEMEEHSENKEFRS